MNKIKKELLRDLLKVKDFLKYSKEGENLIEIRPSIFAPLYINVKSIWGNADLIRRITYELSKLCETSDYVIGIETGGSPYAVIISQLTCSKLILCRKEKKGILGFLTSNVEKNSSVHIIDDVIASGNSMENAINSIKKKTKNIVLLNIFSYGMDKQITKKYNIKIVTMFKVEDILEFILKEDQKILSKHIKEYQKKLLERI